LFDFDRVRCDLLRLILVRNWCGASPAVAALCWSIEIPLLGEMRKLSVQNRPICL
jgi:hypothetical protein